MCMGVLTVPQSVNILMHLFVIGIPERDDRTFSNPPSIPRLFPSYVRITM